MRSNSVGKAVLFLHMEDTMKKTGIVKFLVVLLALLFFAGCQASLEDNSENDIPNGFGSICVNDSTRAINKDDIKIAKVEVTGYGITEALTATVTDVTDGAGTFKVENVPVGNNRIITVWGYDSSNIKLGSTVVRAICDVTNGKTTSVTVTKDTTALANVFVSLLDSGTKISDISSSDVSKIQNAIDSSKSWALINSEQIANDYKSGSLKTATSYVLTPATATFTSNYSDGITVQIGDPVSSILSNFTDSNGTISNIAPGTWQVYVTTSDGTTKTFVKFSADETKDLGTFGKKTEITDKIIVHAESKYKYIWYWDDGASGTAATLTEEDSSWNVWEISKTKINLLLSSSNVGNGDWSGKTSDKSLEAGEWWYKNGEWLSSNPDDSENPILLSFDCNASGTITGKTTFTISASDNLSLDSAVLYLDDAVLTKVSMNGTSQTVSYIWDTTLISNGKHTISCVVQDAAGNASASKEISVKTQNENVAPVAVISGTSKVVTSAEKTYSAASSYDPNGTIASYRWSVTGATISGSSTDSTVKVVFGSSEGSATITLVVTDNEGKDSDTVSKKVTISSKAESTDFRDETIYFLMTTRFYDGDESNNEYCWDEGGEYLKFSDDVKDCAWRGDFKGLAEKLDYIKALGFSAIWITPVVQNASGIDYHGYHAYNFKKVDPRYESDGFGYQQLIDACHEKGIKVIQDIVLNHTGNFGEENLFHMFDKETTPYVNKDVATTTSIPRSPFMKVASDSYGTSRLSAGLSMAGGSDYDSAIGSVQYAARINAMKEDSIDTDLIYHHAKQIEWNSELCQLGQMAGDCVDLNTENPTVFNYLVDAYNQYIDMGVDAFRIDTVKHISRYTFNNAFIPAFKERGGDDFYIFGETCARYRGKWNEGVPALSPSFYTWKETVTLPWNTTGGAAEAKTNSSSASTHFETYKSSFDHPAWSDGIANHLLNENNYHTPDYSMRSGLDQIDFPMHWAFNSASEAFSTAVNTNDPDFNDATWNVVYVDSHDYAPDNAPESQRFNGYWPDKLDLMFTFRGIPCIYYGSEIEFKKGCAIDPANTRTSLENSGRAYFGDHLEGSVTASDYGDYTASGEVATTLSNDLAQHIIRLNKIRRAIPALRKGQYSTQGCSGSIAFKRRYTDSNVDSFVLVAINGQATFTGIPSGNYIEVITGKTVSSSGSLTTDSIGEGNMRVYVLQTSTCEVTGKIGEDGAYLK